MRLKLIAKAEGKTAVPYSITVLAGGYGISVFGDPKGMINSIEVSTAIRDQDEELPSITPTPEGPVKAVIRANRTKTQDDLFELLHYIESLGAFWLGIRKIHWETAKREWVPETDDDKRRLTLLSHGIDWSFPEEPQLFSPRIMYELVEDRDRLRYLMIPMAFVREGINDYKRFRFVSAFYQFYFYLEDLYAGGKWKTKAVKAAFRRSPQMREVAQQAVELFSRPTNRSDRIGLEEFLAEQGFKFTAEGILDLIVEMRGQLHHFSQRSPKTHGHPLNQAMFKPLAYLLMHCCMATYPLIIRDGEPR